MNYLVIKNNSITGIFTSDEDLLTHLGVNITDKGKVKLLKDEVQLSMSYNMESYTKEEVIKEVIRCQLKEIECLLKIGIYKLKRI